MLLEQFETFKNNQMQFNMKLLERLEKQQNYIENSIDEREVINVTIKNVKTRKQLVEEAELEKEKKIWWKLERTNKI